jgi:hypothetical protein
MCCIHAKRVTIMYAPPFGLPPAAEIMHAASPGGSPGGCTLANMLCHAQAQGHAARKAHQGRRDEVYNRQLGCCQRAKVFVVCRAPRCSCLTGGVIVSYPYWQAGAVHDG